MTTKETQITAGTSARGDNASSSGGEAIAPPPSETPAPGIAHCSVSIPASLFVHSTPHVTATPTPIDTPTPAEDDDEPGSPSGRRPTDLGARARENRTTEIPPRTGTGRVLQDILDHLTRQDERTNARFASLNAAQAFSQDEISRLQASRHANIRPAQEQERCPLNQPIGFDNARDVEVAELRRAVLELNSKIHRATSTAPELDRVLEETQQTPFTRKITNVSVRGYQKIKLECYNGRGDPKEFLTSFSVAINRAELTTENFEAGRCQIFIEHLTGPALNWFSRLKPNSINSFHQLTSSFLKHYSPLIENQTSNADLWSLSQGPKESLRAFIDRFKEVVTKITVPDEAAIVALRNAVWYDSKFRDDITLHVPDTLEDALHRAARYVELEEEKLVLARKYNPPKVVAAKEPTPTKAPLADHVEPRQHFDRNINQARKPATFVVNSDGTTRPWNKYVRNPETPSTAPMFCEYHKSSGHNTEDCRYLQILLLEKYKSGDITVECDRAPGQKNQRRNEATAKQFLSDCAQTEKTVATGNHRNDQTNDPAKRQRNGKAIADAPVVVRQVTMIMGGLQNCNDSVRSIKQYRKKAEVAETWSSTSSTPVITADESISFTQDDLKGLDTPHNDPLVVELIIGDSRVTRVLIDTGSSVDLIFKDTLTAMSISDRQIKPISRPLAGFDGDFVMTIGTVKLPMFVRGMITWVKFVVIDKPAIYNAILGTPWLHQMQAIPSTYHQCVKFPTHNGVFTLRGNQQVARTCFLIEHRARNAKKL